MGSGGPHTARGAAAGSLMLEMSPGNHESRAAWFWFLDFSSRL